MNTLVYTATEAAEILKTRPGKVIELLNCGEIPAYREGKNWKIPKECLERYVVARATKEAEERRKA